ncbi:hypothetical protein HZB03_04810 [Candidatus Woesearchaeota archaeon]|nr:hypothetical protein [Candidatus Woesearchaeota archaeon]
MVLEIIVAAILIAVGFLSIYLSIKTKEKDKDLVIVLLVGLIALFAGAWIIFTKLTLMLILKKLAGLCLTGAGFFLIFAFPDITQYQLEGFSLTGIFIGIVLFVVGLYLLLLA